MTYKQYLAAARLCIKHERAYDEYRDASSRYAAQRGASVAAGIAISPVRPVQPRWLKAYDKAATSLRDFRMELLWVWTGNPPTDISVGLARAMEPSVVLECLGAYGENELPALEAAVTQANKLKSAIVRWKRAK